MKVAIFFILLSCCMQLACLQHCRQQTVTVCDEDEVIIAPTRGKGDKGEVGASGESGIPGIKGSKGEKGIPGMKGRKAKRGRVGQKGIPGECVCNIEEIRNRLTELEMLVLPPVTCATSGGRGRRILRLGEEVFCYDGWTVFQKRISGAINFNLPWWEYKTGFGRLNEEFWLGLDNIHNLTRNQNCRLRIDLVAFDNDTAYAEYSSFSVGDENDLYRLHVGGFNGTAGDSLYQSGNTHNNMPFTTKDKDNDNMGSSNCAETWNSGWWFNSCFRSNLNAPWGESTGGSTNIIWHSWKGWNEALKETTMKLRCD